MTRKEFWAKEASTGKGISPPDKNGDYKPLYEALAPLVMEFHRRADGTHVFVALVGDNVVASSLDWPASRGTALEWAREARGQWLATATVGEIAAAGVAYGRHCAEGARRATRDEELRNHIGFREEVDMWRQKDKLEMAQLQQQLAAEKRKRGGVLLARLRRLLRRG